MSALTYAGPPAPTEPPLPWLTLRKGVHAFTGDDGGGISTLTVCPSAQIYIKWIASLAADPPRKCVKKLQGVPITIESNEAVAMTMAGLAQLTSP